MPMYSKQYRITAWKTTAQPAKASTTIALFMHLLQWTLAVMLPLLVLRFLAILMEIQLLPGERNPRPCSPQNIQGQNNF